MKWRDARRSHQEQASSSVPKVKTQIDVKSLNSLKASPATRAKNPLSMDIIPCVVVTSLETDAFMAIVAYFDMLMVRGNPARGQEKKVLKDQLLF